LTQAEGDRSLTPRARGAAPAEERRGMDGRTRQRRLGRRAFAATGLAAACLAARPVRAQAWPAKPIRLVVPAPPGGSTDIYARIVAGKLADRLGQPVVIDNRPSAGGTIGAAAVARAAPDGHTLLHCASSVVAIMPGLQPNAGFDPRRDFAPVAMIYEAPLVFVATRAFAPTSIAELIALAKAWPGQLDIAHPGNGTTNHLAAALFNRTAGTEIVLVPYSGNAGVVNALARGDVGLAIDSIPTSGPLMRDGTVRPLAVTGARRSPALPDVPTVAEAGPLPGYEAVFWNGVFAPAGTPAEILGRLNAEIDAVLRLPEVAARLREVGSEPGGGPPEALARRFAADFETWGRVIRQLGVRNE
jgi:tripartite-type tricarboxylate transporter receptor subunit TctC